MNERMASDAQMMFPHNFIGSFLKMAGSFKHLQDLSGLFFQ